MDLTIFAIVGLKMKEVKALIIETYSEPCQTSEMVLFVKMVHGSTKWSNTLKQFVDNSLFECVSPFCGAINYFRKKLHLRCLTSF